VAKQIIDLGTQGTQSGDTVRTAFDKANDNFDELYTDMLKALAYSGDNGSSYYTSTSTSWSYSSAFGDSLPAGTYLMFGKGYANPTDVDFTSEFKMRIGFFDASNNALIATFENVVNNGMHQMQCFGLVTISSTTTVKAGVAKTSGTGTARAGYLQWFAIKVKEG
jgi:hypothetical protein